MERKKPLDNLTIIQRLTDKLTVRRILTALVFGLLTTTITVIFENRTLVFDWFFSYMTNQPDEQLWDLSTKTKDRLVTLAVDNSLINMLIVDDIDLRKNRRAIKFQFSQDSTTEDQFKKTIVGLLPQPVFDLNPKNTQHMTAVLNNEFTCIPFKDSHLVKQFPFLEKKIVDICQIAIPPFYGQFIGTLTLGLERSPTEDELASLKLEASKLAVEIYLRDITHNREL